MGREPQVSPVNADGPGAIGGTGRRYVIGARGSRLALRQVELVQAALRRLAPDVDIVVREIRTEGDRSSAPLSAIGGLGVFTKAIEDALLAGEIDIAVHSLKDLPTELAPGLAIAAVPPREDVRDALVSRGDATLAELRAGARIGTGAGRRAVQLRRLRPEVEPAEVRGNVDTRIRKVDEGAYDGVLLAMAGLARLSLTARASEIFPVEAILPAVGQGALGVEVRADDAGARALVGGIDDARTRAAVEAERAFLRRLGGGCRLPVAAHACIERGELRLRGMIAAADDAPDATPARLFEGEARGAIGEPEALGTRLADDLLALGARAFVDVAAAANEAGGRPRRPAP
ncbi:MAG: hydroxymethylbilane synthase [Dehalococcoidia bacterium]|nr:hydroxymethylbilane synthase [Dehalococcoidia bacterium]